MVDLLDADAPTLARADDDEDEQEPVHNRRLAGRPLGPVLAVSGTVQRDTVSSISCRRPGAAPAGDLPQDRPTAY
jgi:hypothetical protein